LVFFIRLPKGLPERREKRSRGFVQELLERTHGSLECFIQFGEQLLDGGPVGRAFGVLLQ